VRKRSGRERLYFKEEEEGGKELLEQPVRMHSFPGPCLSATYNENSLGLIHLQSAGERLQNHMPKTCH